jgi:hypothetical protein
MYYFDILEVLQQEEGRQWSVLDMYAELSRQRSVNMRNINRMMFKMFMTRDDVFRVERKNTQSIIRACRFSDETVVTEKQIVNINVPEFVYFYRKF